MLKDVEEAVWMEITWLVLGVSAAFLVAWVNGANNAANAIGTAVGARALDLRKALYLAASFDFIGALLFGKFVSATLLKGIVDTSVFNDPDVVVYGMISALLATGIWVIAATWLRIPMSISQAIVGGVMGFGLVTLGVDGVDWGRILTIVIAWVVLPFMGAGIAIGFYKYLSKRLESMERRQLIYASNTLLFTLVFSTIFLLSVKTLKARDLMWTLSTTLVAALAITMVYHIITSRITPTDAVQARKTIFRILLIVSAAAMAFSHGANDVANSAGPLAGVLYAVYHGGVPPGEIMIPLEALVLSATGISIGILMWGQRVVETIGEKITTLNIETAFVAQFAGSIAVLIVTRLGLPVSTTVAIVGGVAGIGFARGIESINIKMLAKIMSWWFIAFPAVAGISGGIYYLITMFLK